MADTAADIVARWRNQVPPDVDVDDVVRVVEHYFPDEHSFSRKGGSHFLKVHSEAIRLAVEIGYSGTSGFRGGRLSISAVSGKKVKRWQVEDLLKAVEIKETYDRFQAEQKGKRK